MSNLDALLRGNDPAWPVVRRWLDTSSRSVEVLQGDRTRGELNLLHLQATIESALGAVALETGGILLDHGWLRLLGSGSEGTSGDFVTWNSPGEDFQPFRGGIIVGYDVIGGFFAINAGAFSGEPGDIYYFSPRTLRWDDLAMTYSHFLYWATNGDVPGFYAAVRWRGWEDEVSALSGDQVISMHPALWSDPDTALAERTHSVVRVLELWNMQQDIARRNAEPPDGPTVRPNPDGWRP